MRLASRAPMPASRAERWISAGFSSCEVGGFGQHEIGAGRERVDGPNRARCRRCRRAACPRPVASTAYVGGGWSVREKRSATSPTRWSRSRRSRCQSNALPQSPPTSFPRWSSRPSRRDRPGGPPLDAVAQEDVEAVDVDAVVGMLVRDDDGGQVLDRDVLLEVAERAVAAVEPDRGRARPDEVAAARAAARPAERTRAAEDRQLTRPGSSTLSAPDMRLDAPTSGPRKRAPRLRNVATSPLVMNMWCSMCRRVTIVTRTEQLANRERSLVRARDQHDVPPHHVTDRTGQQRIVRAAEHERVDAGRAHRRQEALGQHVHLVGVDVARLHELDEAGARRARELEPEVESPRPRRAGTRPRRSCRRCR